MTTRCSSCTAIRQDEHLQLELPEIFAGHCIPEDGSGLSLNHWAGMKMIRFYQNRLLSSHHADGMATIY